MCMCVYIYIHTIQYIYIYTSTIVKPCMMLGRTSDRHLRRACGAKIHTQCIYIYIYAYMYTHEYVYIYIYIYAFVYVYIYIYIYIYTYIFIYVQTIYIYIYICRSIARPPRTRLKQLTSRSANLVGQRSTVEPRTVELYINK